MSISSQERREREMSISSQERHNSTFSRENGNGHIMDDIQEPTSQNAISSSHGPTFQSLEDQRPYKEVARYRECLKNHAAGIGGNATDGCGEFMPRGEEGTLEALNCSACNCHRNFHRKEIEGHDYAQCPSKCFHYQLNNVGVGPELVGYPTGALRMTVPPHRMIMPCKMGYLSNSQSDHDYEKEEGGGIVKKRFRTKFSQEQKEKMLRFAEKAGWKIQKLEEGVVQQFCQEIGITRRVLKVWMHNNKHNLAKKNTSTAT